MAFGNARPLLSLRFSLLTIPAKANGVGREDGKKLRFICLRVPWALPEAVGPMALKPDHMEFPSPPEYGMSHKEMFLFVNIGVLKYSVLVGVISIIDLDSWIGSF